VEFQEASDWAKKAGRPDRVRLAAAELAKLEKNLARLTIEVPKDARVPGLEISRGDERVGEGAWGTAVPVDPGTSVTLAARAAGYKEWTTTVTVQASEQKTVVIPKLEKLPRPPAKPKPKPSSSRDAESAKSKKTERLAAYAAGGVGVVAVGVGSYFGLRAIGKNRDAEKHCKGSLCDPDGLALNEQANRAATVSNVAFGIGVVALGVGSYFFISSMSDEPSRKSADAENAAVRWSPCIGRDSGAILVTGRW
jgi:serine/threonine-protein kinase